MSAKTKSKAKQPVQNPYETLKNTSSGGIFDRLMGGNHDEEMDLMEQYMERQEEKKPQKTQKESRSLFNYSEYHEDSIVKREISELANQLKGELSNLKRATSELGSDVAEIEKAVINPLPEKPGVYHIRFMEILIKLVQSIRLKIGESRTWLDAMTSKRKKRGSAFMSLTKKKGTQYSLSQELQTSRSVQ